MEPDIESYRQLCLAKHSKPILQKDHGHYEEEAAISRERTDASDAVRDEVR